MSRNEKGQYTKGTSGNRKGRPRNDASDKLASGAYRTRVDSPAPNSEVLNRTDGWFSALSGVGTLSHDKRMQQDFEIDVIDYESARVLWRGDDIAAKAVDVPADDMTRAGFDFVIQDDLENAKETQELVEAKWKDLGLINAFHEGLSFERAYGGGAILIGAKDGSTDMSKPLNINRVRSVDFLTVLESRELIPDLYYANPHAPKYGKVATYKLAPISPGTDVDGSPAAFETFIIHETRLIIFPGIRITRQNITSTQGWGDSIFTRIFAVLRDFKMAWDGSGLLVADFAQPVFKMKGLAELLAQDKDDVFAKRIHAMHLSMSMARAIVIDEEETYERTSTPLSGYAELLREFMGRIAAAVDMPVIKLFGTSPSGLNANGSGEIALWDDKIASLQDKKVIPGLEYLTEIILSSMGKESIEKWSVTARPLRQQTEGEIAETRNKQADTDVKYINAGVATPDEIAMSRFGGDVWSMETLIDFEERAKLEPDLTMENPEEVPEAPEENETPGTEEE